LSPALAPIYLIACCLLLPLRSWLDKAAYGHAPTSRRLVIVLDGVPYQTFADLRAEGRFRRFKDPTRMISTFPSLTNPAMIEILHAEDSPGYEDHYFDRTRNRLLGRIQDRLNGEKFIQGTFRETFDYHAPAFEGSLAYVAAPSGAIAVAQLDLADFRDTFREFCRNSDAPLFVAYIGETDSLAHLGGERPLKSFLRTLDRAIEELSSDSNGQLEIEMFSDHGNKYGEYSEVKLNEAINAAGFTTEKTLGRPNSVVLPKHGLVGSSMLFTAPENRAQLAEVCAKARGVDFAAYESGEGAIELVSRRGRARVRRDADRYRYEDLGGDPLGLLPIIEQMQPRGGAESDPGLTLDANGFASREAWWRATRGYRYADPLRRLFDGFNSHVKNRADVIVSYEDGYMLGSPFLSVFAHLRATHGNLLRGESEGFAISTKLGREELGETVRGYELSRLFGLDKRLKAGTYYSGGGHCQLGPALAKLFAGK
jgi:hypothetical protein